MECSLRERRDERGIGLSATQVTLDGLSEPWKDASVLENLYEGRTQGEVAEYFKERGHDVTGSTISYWMKKLEVNTSHTKHDETIDDGESRECVNYEECGNDTPHPANTICNSCLDAARERDAGSL